MERCGEPREHQHRAGRGGTDWCLSPHTAGSAVWSSQRRAGQALGCELCSDRIAELWPGSCPGGQVESSGGGADSRMTTRRRVCMVRKEWRDRRSTRSNRPGSSPAWREAHTDGLACQSKGTCVRLAQKAGSTHVIHGVPLKYKDTWFKSNVMLTPL